jgi:hypothetical protein
MTAAPFPAYECVATSTFINFGSALNAPRILEVTHGAMGAYALEARVYRNNPSVAIRASARADHIFWFYLRGVDERFTANRVIISFVARSENASL